MKKYLALLLCVAMALSMTACGGNTANPSTPASNSTSASPAASGEKVELVFAHVYANKGDEHQWLTWAADEIEKRSNGQMTMKVYADGTMGSEAEICAQVTSGVIDLGVSEGCAWSDIVNLPALGVFGLPYLYSNPDELKNANQGAVADGFNQLCSENGINLHAFGAMSGGMRHMWTVNDKITKFDDVRGLKIRTPEIKLFMDTVQSFGANATPVAYSDVYTALSQGVVEGCEIDPCSGVDSNWHEVCKYYTKTYHLGSLNIICINENKWNSLTADQQLLLTEVFQEACDQQHDTRASKLADAEKTMEAAGMEIIDLPDEEFQKFKDSVQPMWDEYRDEYGVGDIIDNLQTAAKG